MCRVPTELDGEVQAAELQVRVDMGLLDEPSAETDKFMSDNLPVPFDDKTPELIEPDRLPELERVTDEVPHMSADASVVLSHDTYGKWFGSIQNWLKQAGAENGVDYRASVATAGMDGKGKILFRVKWKALSDKGILYLNLMARTLSLLEQETKKIGMDERKPETSENKQISAENG